MIALKIFILHITLLAARVHTLPLTTSDLSTDFLINASIAEASDVRLVKRQTGFETNSGDQLKQISLNALIGDLENSLFQSALSVSAAYLPEVVVPEIVPTAEEHSQVKRDYEPSNIAPISDHILLLTTKKVPETSEQAAHIIIDRVAVQPHVADSLPLIPTFQLNHTKLIKADESHTASSTKAEIRIEGITTTTALRADPKSNITAHELEKSQNNNSTRQQPIVTPTPAAPPTTTTPMSTITTVEQPLEKIKQAEEQLKEKVAEIEAEPIILSARV